MDEDRTAAKIGSFLSCSDARALIGERRLGTERLLDMLAERIRSEDASANIIKVAETDGKAMVDLISSGMDPGGSNHILLYGHVTAADLDSVVASFPDAHIYRAQELCHQVPACVRES